MIWWHWIKCHLFPWHFYPVTFHPMTTAFCIFLKRHSVEACFIKYHHINYLLLWWHWVKCHLFKWHFFQWHFIQWHFIQWHIINWNITEGYLIQWHFIRWFSASYQCNKRIWIRTRDFRVIKRFDLAERPTVLFPRKNFSTHILDFSLEVTLIPKHLILLWIEFFSSFNIFLELFFNSKTVFCHPNTMNEWRSVGDKVWRTPFSFSPMNVWKWEILVEHKYSNWKSPCNSGFEVLST